MPRRIAIHAVDVAGNIIHQYGSIAEARAAGHSHDGINNCLNHGAGPIAGLTWRKANTAFASGPEPIERLQAARRRLEAAIAKAARRLEAIVTDLEGELIPSDTIEREAA